MITELFTKLGDAQRETNFANLPKLHTLNISNNQLNKIDLTAEGIEGFECELKELKKLNLARNQFNLMSDILVLKDSVNLPKLTSIDFSENPFMSDAAIRSDKE
mmetsp:Transcript_16867/g.13824  ORF Transcript_16867/g.13824 Transcript_16867/m.13824 type:complete len:104 (+) Transcript_16867:563-874(+)